MKGNEKDEQMTMDFPRVSSGQKHFMFVLGFDGCCYTAVMNSFQPAYPIVLPIQSKNHHNCNISLSNTMQTLKMQEMGKNQNKAGKVTSFINYSAQTILLLPTIRMLRSKF